MNRISNFSSSFLAFQTHFLAYDSPKFETFFKIIVGNMYRYIHYVHRPYFPAECTVHCFYGRY